MPKKPTKDHWSAQFNTVTPFSKALALILFITLPMITFLLGIALGQTIQSTKKTESTTPIVEHPHDDDNQVACIMDAKMCPDGSYVSRQGATCEFAPCP